MSAAATAAGGSAQRSELTLRLDQAWRIFSLNQELIRSADQKTSLLIVMSTLLVSYVATNLDRIMHLGTLQSVMLILFIVGSGTFYYFALSTLFPRRHTQKSRGTGYLLPGTEERVQVARAGDIAAERPNHQLIFFADIAARPDADDYVTALGEVPLDTVFEDLSRQIYLVSCVASSKYLAYHRAWRAILMEVSLFVLLEFSLVV